MPSASILQYDDDVEQQVPPLAPRACEGLTLVEWVVLVLTGLAFWAGTIIGILAVTGVGV